MANNFDSNITQKLIRIFLEKFESARVLSKSVNTQLLSGQFDPASGDEVNFKRPTDYVSVRTATGDLTGLDNDVIAGKAKGVVQDFFSVSVSFNQVDQALKMDQLDELLAPMATRIVTDLELDFANFMMVNTGLSAGDHDTAVSTWKDIANWGATLQAAGIPSDAQWMAAVNPFTQVTLSEIQRSLGSGGTSGTMIADAMKNATIVENYAGLKVMSATTLASFTDATSDRSALINGTPNVTYLGAKDSMQQTLILDALGTGSIVAGTQLTIADTFQLNLSTRQVMLDGSGSPVPWVGTVLNTVAINTNAATIVVSGPAIFEASGQFNTVTRAIVNNDVVTLLGTALGTFQPNLFWHPQAFGIGSVPLQKLFATDTIGETEDGLQLRVTKFSDGVKNIQKVRFDLLPAYATLNPFFAGQGFGV